MIRRHVQQYADGGAQRWRQIDLIGRRFQDVSASRRERLKRQRGDADIAAHLRIAAGAADEMRDQRRGGRLAVGAGDGDQRAVGATRGALAAEQFDVADDLDAFFARAARSSAASDASAARRAPGSARRSSTSRGRSRFCVVMPAALACSTFSGASSKAMTSAPPAINARADTVPEPPRPNSATFLPAKVVMGIKIISTSTTLSPPAPAPPRRSRSG